MWDILRPVMYRPKMGIVKDRKLGLKPKIFLFSKTVQDDGNWYLSSHTILPAGDTTSMCILRSLCYSWWAHRGRSDAENDDVRDGGDGDGDAGVTHRLADVEGVVVRSLLRRLQVVERLHDHEHVVDTYRDNISIIRFIRLSKGIFISLILHAIP